MSHQGHMINKKLPISSKPPKSFIYGQKSKRSPRVKDPKDIAMELEVIRERQEHVISEPKLLQMSPN